MNRREMLWLTAAGVLVGCVTGGNAKASGERTFGEHLKGIDPDNVDWKSKDLDYWRSVLSEQQVAVCRQQGTERAFTGKYYNEKTEGVYLCSSCGSPLYSSKTKFKSGTGWPSFWAPITEDAVTEHIDTAFGMIRTELKCARCDAHLGHVFNDGPPPTGRRHCINSICLILRPTENTTKQKKGQ